MIPVSGTLPASKYHKSQNWSERETIMIMMNVNNKNKASKSSGQHVTTVLIHTVVRKKINCTIYTIS